MQSYKSKIKTVVLAISIIVISSVWQGFCFSSPNKEDKPKDVAQEPTVPFKIGEKFLYQVHFNGIKVGTIELEYQGRKKIDKIWQDVIRLASNVKILKLF